MIAEIQISPPVATYQNPVTLDGLRQINYVFGANGTGKTTVSRVIAQSEGHDHCPLKWQGGTELECIVYNQDFVDANFNQDGPLQGVFTLGENQVDAEREIARLQPKIDKLNIQIARLNNKLDGEDGESGKKKELADLEPKIRDKCWKQKQLHDGYFREAFTGVRGKSENYKTKVIAEKSSNTSEVFLLDELKEKAETVYSQGLERASPLENISAENLIAFESNELLQKVIIGNQDVDIAALIDRLGNSDWIKQGLKYHRQEPDTCPFCQQSTDTKFNESLNSFFSEAYDNDIQSLKELQGNYQRASDQLHIELKSNSEANNAFLNRELFDAEAQTISERLKINQGLLEAKLVEPSQKVALESIEELFAKLTQLVAEANEATNTHNETVANISTEKEVLTSQVWRYVVNELDDDLQSYEQQKSSISNAIDGMQESLRTKRQELRALKAQISELEKQTTSIQPTITAINELLDRFGFHSFKVGETDGGRHYRIVRDNGDDASHSLSEGEKSFITFLYFYHLIKGAQSSSGLTTNRVVVFDDPISSLDSDILYIVSSLIKGVMKEIRNQTGQIKQMFLLTHNVYFHKEITFDGRRSARAVFRDESFWMVKKQLNNSIIERCETNPIQSAYELLWDDVKSNDMSSISLQNTLRRILENYFTMWGGMGKDDICDLFEGRDRLICQSLFSWVNDGSHSIHDDLYINHGEQTNQSYLRVFREVFNKANQLGHYEMMVGSTQDFENISDETTDSTRVNRTINSVPN